MLIGLSAVMVMALFGRIAGIAGITQGALGGVVPLAGAAKDRDWRLAFLLGLLAAPAGDPAGGRRGDADRALEPAGDGHRGPAGRHRHRARLGLHLGARGLRAGAAVAAARWRRSSTFMAAGFLTVFLLRHVIGG